jgi:hypothetical protein
MVRRSTITGSCSGQITPEKALSAPIAPIPIITGGYNEPLKAAVKALSVSESLSGSQSDSISLPVSQLIEIPDLDCDSDPDSDSDP